MPVFRDRRVGFLHRLPLNDARLVVHQEALHRGALTSTELASRSGPTEVVRVTIRSPLWATPVASAYFRGEDDAREWAADLLARLPCLARATPSASSAAWSLEVTAAKVTRVSTTASLSRWRAGGGPVLAILEPDGAVLGGTSTNGEAPAYAAGSSPEDRLIACDPLDELVETIAAGLAVIEPRWVVASVARVTWARDGNVFLALKGQRRTSEAILLASAVETGGPMPAHGDLIAARVAEVSLSEPDGRLSLLIDRFGAPAPPSRGWLPRSA